MNSEKTYYVTAIVALFVLGCFMVIYGTMDSGYGFEITAGFLFVIGIIMLLFWSHMFPKKEQTQTEKTEREE